jgi:hypothetical protein
LGCSWASWADIGLFIHPKVDGLKLLRPSRLTLLILSGRRGCALKAACDEIRTIVKNLGVRTLLAQADALERG